MHVYLYAYDILYVCIVYIYTHLCVWHHARALAEDVLFTFVYIYIDDTSYTCIIDVKDVY